MPWVKVEGQKFSHDADSSKDLSRYQVGLSYFYLGQNTNVKVGYGRVDPKVGRSTNLFTVQFQIFYF